MSGPDLTPDAVERLAKSLAFVANKTGMTVEKCEHVTDDAAATLRALSARVAELEGLALQIHTGKGSTQMAFKMLRVSPNIQAGLNSDGLVVINNLFWTDKDGNFVDAVLTKEDCALLGNFVASGQIEESRADKPIRGLEQCIPPADQKGGAA